MRTKSYKLLIILTIACLPLYLALVPVGCGFYYESDAYETCIKYCPKCYKFIRLHTCNEETEDYETLVEGNDNKCAHEFHDVLQERQICENCGANMVSYYLGDKKIAEMVQGSAQEMCESGKHLWHGIMHRQPTKKPAGFISWTCCYMRCYGNTGLLFLLGYMLLFIRLLRYAKGMLLRRSAALTIQVIVYLSLMVGAVSCGFAQIIWPTIRTVEIAEMCNQGVSLNELREYVLTSYWPVLGMAVFTVLITILTMSVIFILYHQRADLPST